jgi:adenine-specific DNA-methyltransferase
MDKMRMESPDMTEQNVEKLAALFPNCVTETKDENGKPKKAINFGLLRQMLSGDVIDGDEAYEFTWVGKKASIVEANKPIRKTLRPCKEESVNWDSTDNLYIEGDNLEVLKLMQESYLGQIKVIYIDPPYNTGHDFIYPDSFIMDNEDYNEGTGYFDEDGNVNFSRENGTSAGRYHSDWCSMMYSRLMLARNLLADDGVIFISIDDSEQVNLKKCCDEIFGESNFVECLKWKRKKQPSFLSKHTAKVMEYILVYAKKYSDLEKLSIESISDSTKKVVNLTNNYSERLFQAGFRVKSMDNGILPKGKYTIRTMTIEYLDDIHVVNGRAQNDVRVVAQFTVTQENINKYIKEDLLFVTANNGLRRDVSEEESSKRKSITDLLLDWGDNQDSEIEMKELFGASYFDYTKPSKLIFNLVKSVSENDFTVMDFFSGSATTAHAVMKLNAEDGGTRKFIMVQLPEPCDEKSEAYKAGYKTICDIGKERIRRASKKIAEDNPETAFDGGFRVLKLDDTNMKDVYYAADEYDQGMLRFLESNIKDDRTDLDLLFGCLLEWGLPLSLPYTSEQIEGCTVHTYNDGDLIACFAENVPESVVKAIAKRQPLRAVFRDNSFENSPSKINVGEIFKLMAPDTRVKVI